MKAQGISRDSLPWRAPFQPYFSYVALVFTCLICFFKGFDSFMPFDAPTFITHYVGFVVFGVGYFGYRCKCIATRNQSGLIDLVTYGIKSRSPQEVDLVTGGVDLMDTPDIDYVDPNWAALSWKAKLRHRVVHYIKNW